MYTLPLAKSLKSSDNGRYSQFAEDSFFLKELLYDLLHAKENAVANYLNSKLEIPLVHMQGSSVAAPMSRKIPGTRSFSIVALYLVRNGCVSYGREEGIARILWVLSYGAMELEGEERKGYPMAAAPGSPN